MDSIVVSGEITISYGWRKENRWRNLIDDENHILLDLASHSVVVGHLVKTAYMGRQGMKKHQREHCLEVIKEVLRHWDPIGIIDLNSKDGLVENEYDSYATGVLSALKRGENAKGIGIHLAQVHSDSIGLGGVHPTDQEQEIGEKPVAWRARSNRGKVDF